MRFAKPESMAKLLSTMTSYMYLVGQDNMLREGDYDTDPDLKAMLKAWKDRWQAKPASPAAAGDE